MKWQEFEKNNPKALYVALRQICEEVHSKDGFFCNYCYQREGWYCFPCDKVRKIHEKRDSVSAIKSIVGFDRTCLTFLLGGGRFWK